MRKTARFGSYLASIVLASIASMAAAQTTSTGTTAAAPQTEEAGLRPGLHRLLRARAVVAGTQRAAQPHPWRASGPEGVAVRVELTADIVKEFMNQRIHGQPARVRARRCRRDGWLVRGTFYATDSGGNIIPTELLGGEQKPNTEVSVSVANLSKDPNTPFIVFGKAEALKGQGAPVGWNPYVVAAKFVINQVESATDLDKLAKDIVQTIMSNKAIVEEKALASNQ